MELVKGSIRDLEQMMDMIRSMEAAAGEQDGRSMEKMPDEAMIRENIEKGNLYIRLVNGRLAVAVIVDDTLGPEYDRVNWTYGGRYAVLRWLSVHPNLQGKGFGTACADDVIQLLRGQDCDCIRCDLAESNRRLIDVLEIKLGFRRCGVIGNGADRRVCFDKPLKRETPLLPVRMTPAYRSGELTPWGGEKLARLYGKHPENPQTGESLEVSCIPGLESRDDMGRTLSQLFSEFGRKMIGKYHCRPFPLLLKLIDAKDALSVQVHPDNEYAQRHENGKLGKTEAWLILETPPKGGELVYGIVPGTSPRQLRTACEGGKTVEPLLRRVTVKTGDVCYIPAGCVHAIGAGILLYEIQESSDITYRFYDWDRQDSRGNRRELHLEKALAVADLRMSPYPIHVERAVGVKRVLNEEFFTLDVLRPGDTLRVPQIRDFGFLTALAGQMMLCWPGGKMELRKGDTCFLPNSLPAELQLEGSGSAALSMPN